MNILILLGVLLACQLPVSAAEVTVYNQNLGLIKDVRSFNLKNGINELTIVDVPAQLDATSVHFRSLTAPDAVTVLEQNFQYDLISQDKLLDRYVGRDIGMERYIGTDGGKERKEVLFGKLLSNEGGRILQSEGKIYVNPPGSPVLPALPEGLLTRPTLLWKVNARQAGAHECELSYLTGGMSWRADYILVTDAADTKADLNAWVTVTNTSGASYTGANLKLIAGDIHRVLDSIAFGGADKIERSRALMMGNPFFEYHLYALARPTNLRDNETKQIELNTASAIPIHKRYIFDSVHSVDSGSHAALGKAQVVLEIKNSKDAGLGSALPQGKVRVYKRDAQGSLQFIGEDVIDHTPKDETMRLRLGNAFDVVIERVKTDQQRDEHKRIIREEYMIKLRNHKDEDVVVTVVEKMWWGAGWTIPSASQPWVKKDAQIIEFEVPIRKEGESILTYTVKYNW